MKIFILIIFIISFQQNSKLSKNFFFDYLHKITKHLKNDISKKMYLKIHGFLQGSDNMVLINSAKLCKNNKVFMPFGTLKFISIICKYYDFKKDIISLNILQEY